MLDGALATVHVSGQMPEGSELLRAYRTTGLTLNFLASMAAGTLFGADGGGDFAFNRNDSHSCGRSRDCFDA